METIEFDICGQICPSALLTALREINGHKEALRSGARQLMIKTDARDATRTIPTAVENMGYRVEVDKREGCYCIRIFVE